MQQLTSETPKGKLRVRLATLDDVDYLVELNNTCFPSMMEGEIVWTRGHLAAHQKAFPDGQIVVELDDVIIGAVATLIVDFGDTPYRPHTYAGITDGGYFYNHDPRGDTLYGADVYVDPKYRGLGAGALLYDARRQLCKRLNLRRIVAGGRLFGYHEHAAKMRPEGYVEAVENGELPDLVLGFQLREGFVVRGILRNYVTDPKSRNNATFLEWQNPDHVPVPSDERKVRVACAQYRMRPVASFEQFAEFVEYFVDTASDYRADFVVFPEFFSVQLLSQKPLRNLPSLKGIEHLAGLEEEFMELMSRLAREYGIHIIAGSHPMKRGDQTYNVCPVFFPDGSSVVQPKLHITPAEKQYWGITGGDELRVINTAKARIGVLICYDSEFPEAARYLADEGAEIIFVPYCTDDRPAYQRVRVCSQARAIENQVYVVTTGVIGNLPSVAAMDIHYGKASVFTPNDFEFARDGIQAEADSNVEMLLVTDLDVNDLYRSRASGSVRPRQDRRHDLFEFQSRVKNHVTDLTAELDRPLSMPRDPEES